MPAGRAAIPTGRRPDKASCGAGIAAGRRCCRPVSRIAADRTVAAVRVLESVSVDAGRILGASGRRQGLVHYCRAVSIAG